MKKIISLVLTLVTLLSCMVLFASCGEDATVGEITLELYPEHAPITVENFLSLVDAKFYDGLTFHRIYKGFMIQGGDPKGDGTGDSGKTIKGEFTSNGVDNPISHTRGTISMARGSHSMDSASCQFFICDADSTFLDGDYAAFGKVVEGMDMVDKIAGVSVSANLWGEMSNPNVKVVIQSIRRVEGSENKVVMKVKIGG